MLANKQKSYWKKLVIFIIVDLFTTYGLTRNYITSNGPLFPVCSFFSFIFFIVFFFFLYYWFYNVFINKRALKCSILSAIILAVCQCVGTDFALHQHLNLKSVFLYWSILSLVILYSLLISLMLTKKDFIKEKIKEVTDKPLRSIFANKHSFLITFIIILVLWVPAFLAVYPGIYSYDAGPQVHQIYGTLGLNAHHPVLHTLFLNSCFYVGNLFFGDYNCGLTIHIIIQALFMALCFALAIKHMKKYHLSYIIQLFALIFFALSPIIQIFCLMTTKDIIFAGFFLLILLNLIDLVLDTENSLKNKKFIVLFIIETILMCLFRNQGLILLVIIGLVCFFVLRKKRIKIITLFVCPIIFVLLITGSLFNSFGITPANSREALSVPIQQIARVVNNNKDSITEEQLETIHRYLPQENIDEYNPWTSDFVKEGFNQENFKNDKISFFKVWLELFQKNPSAYIDSFLYGSYGYFYVDQDPYWIQFILYDGAWLTNDMNILNIERHSLFPLYDKYLRNVSVNQILDKVPVVSCIASQAFPFLLTIIVCAFIFYKKCYKIFVPIIFVLLFWLTMLAGPLIAIRYAFPIIVCVPTILGMIQYDKISF